MSDRATSPSDSETSPPGREVVPYHQKHTKCGLPACPLCGWKSLVIPSYGRTQQHRSYYVTCEHCAASSDSGLIEGPTRASAEEAGKAFTDAMHRYAESFHEGNEGEYHTVEPEATLSEEEEADGVRDF